MTQEIVQVYNQLCTVNSQIDDIQNQLLQYKHTLNKIKQRFKADDQNTKYILDKLLNNQYITSELHNEYSRVISLLSKEQFMGKKYINDVNSLFIDKDIPQQNLRIKIKQLFQDMINYTQNHIEQSKVLYKSNLSKQIRNHENQNLVNYKIHQLCTKHNMYINNLSKNQTQLTFIKKLQNDICQLRPRIQYLNDELLQIDSTQQFNTIQLQNEIQRLQQLFNKKLNIDNNIQSHFTDLVKRNQQSVHLNNVKSIQIEQDLICSLEKII